MYSFWFNSEANRKLFVGAPFKYWPRCGGFSAYRIANEAWDALPDISRPEVAPRVNVDAFIVRDGALYLEASHEYKKMFLASASTVAKAEKKWREWCVPPRVVCCACSEMCSAKGIIALAEQRHFVDL